jgi:hypothetical protein
MGIKHGNFTLRVLFWIPGFTGMAIPADMWDRRCGTGQNTFKRFIALRDCAIGFSARVAIGFTLPPWQ